MSAIDVERGVESNVLATTTPHADGRRKGLASPWSAWCLAVCVVIVTAADLTHVNQAISRDEGAFFVMAQAILHGRLPYRDLFDHKSPGIYFLLAPVLAVTSPFSVSVQLVVMRLLTLATNLVTAGGLVVLGSRWKGLRTGILAAGLWLVTLPLFEGALVQTEPFAVAATVWAFVAAGGRTRWRSAALAGGLLALGTMFKQTAVLAAPGVALVLYGAMLDDDELVPRDRALLLGRSAVFAMGLLAPWLVLVGAFAAAGALSALLSQVVVANVRYPPDPPHVIAVLVKQAFLSAPFAFVLPAAFCGYGCVQWLAHPLEAQRRLHVGWCAVTATILLNLVPFLSHAYLHYWLQLLPWMALLSAGAVMGFLTWARAMQPPVVGVHLRGGDAPYRAALVPLAMVALLALSGAPRASGPNDAMDSQQLAAGTWIETHVPKTASLLVAPAQPELYFLSGHLPVTSYEYILPVNMTPTLLGNLHKQIANRAFDYVLWQTNPGVPDFAPDYRATYATLTRSYHVVSVDDALGVVLFAPNASPRARWAAAG